MSTVHGGQGSIITDGLVLNLNAANPRSYSPPYTGTTWTDLSGNGNNGTLTNGPTFNSSNGGSIVLDSSDDYINFSGNNAIDISTNTSVTFSVWVNLVFYNYGNPGLWRTGNNFMIFQGGTYRPWVRWNGTNILQPNTGYTTPLNEWIHLTYIVESGGPGVYYYTNGQLRHSSTHSISTPSFSITQLGYQLSLGERTPGKYAMVTIYNRALTAQEVSQNFNATRARFGI